MPPLCGSLPFIDHVAHMRNDHFTEIEVGCSLGVPHLEKTNFQGHLAVIDKLGPQNMH